MAQPLNATFYAFRQREKGGVLTAATIGYVIGALFLLVAFVGANFGLVVDLMRIGAALGEGAAEPPPPNPMNIVVAVLLVFVWLFFFYVLVASYEAACLRWMIHGESGGGLLGLKLDAPTWRVYSCYWLWFAVNLGLSIVTSMLAMPFMFMFMGASMGGDPESIVGPMVVVYIVQYGLYYGGLAFLGVRFAPGAATSVALKRFAYFDAWRVTRLRFWELLLSFFIVWLIYTVIVMFLVLAAIAIFAASAIPAFMGLGPDPSPEAVENAFATLFAPQNLAVFGGLYIVIIVGAVFFQILSYGINARAVIAAMEEGKIPGITLATAKTFE